MSLTKGMGVLPTPVLQGIRIAFQVKGAPAVNLDGALFDRTSMFGLISPAGTVFPGNMYTPGFELLAATDTFETGTAGSWGGITGGTAGFSN